MLKLIMLICLLVFTSEVSAQELPFVLLEDVRIPMRDGTTIAGYISYPRNATSPVLLRFSSYPRPNDIKATEQIFYMATRLGYAFAEFHIRGKGSSEGEIEPFESDGDDAYDLIDWLSKQPWCNGEVGMTGGSYLGFTQWAALKNPHPALKTIVPMVAVAPGIDFPIVNGIFITTALRWINYTTNTRYTEDELYNDEKHWNKLGQNYYATGIAFNQIDSLDNNRRKIFQRWVKHPTYDEYWSSLIPSTKEQYAKINIPILTMTGYFDDDQRGAFHYYNLHNHFGNTHAVSKHVLFIGPYDHFAAQGQRHYPSHQNYKFDSSAYVNKIQLNVQWFNHVFKGAPRPPLLKDRVNYYLIGVGWQHGNSLQAVAPDTLSQFLFAGKKYHHMDRQQPGKSKAELSMNFDPRLDKIDTIRTSTPGNVYMEREDQLVFESAPLKEDFDLVGSPVADLHIRFSGMKDADIRVAYFEVDKDGKSFILSEMDQRLSHYHDERERRLLEPNKVHHLTLNDSYFMAKRIAKGSRIRFIVHLLNDPIYQRNFGSGKEVSRETKADITKGKLSIIIDKGHKNAIHLPGKQASQHTSVETTESSSTQH